MSEDYSQPDFYRFNQDSLQLVKWIINNVSNADSILDLGAGSGIIGIELARHFKSPKLTLLELQSAYEAHLRKNIEIFIPVETKTNILILSFSQFVPVEKFDLIVCNPPYYLPGSGEVSLDPKRAMSRSFLVDSWDVLLNKISHVMSRQGRCFLVIKDEWLLRHIEGKAHQYNLNFTIEYVEGVIILMGEQLS